MEERTTSRPGEPSRYEREITAAGEDSLSRIARRISPGEIVLDLGTGPGALGRWLSARGCVVDGIEKDPSDAATARASYRTVHELDLESGDLAAAIGDHRYDVIVLADVLEHVRDPGRVLDAIVPLLRPSGRVLISVPNVAYAGVIAALARGDFPYAPLGLLDATHLRFFTRRSLLRLLTEHGLGATALEVVTRRVHESEFRGEHVDELPPALVRAILSLPDALTYQLVAEAAPGVPTAPIVADTAIPRLTFGVKLYWRAEGEGFAEDRATLAAGEVGRVGQILALHVPALDRPPVELRLDVADRRGFVRLRAVRLRDADGGALWEWEGEAISLASTPSHGGLTEVPVDGERWWLSSGEDPWIVLPATPAALASASGRTIEVELESAIAPVALALTRAIAAREHAWNTQRAALEGRLAALDVRIAGLEQDLAEAAAAAAENDAAQRAEIERLERWTRRPLRAVRRGVAPRSFVLTPSPRADVAAAPDGGWESQGSAPTFALAHGSNRFPAGWVEIDLAIAVDDGRPVAPRLRARCGAHGPEVQVLLPRVEGGRSRGVVKLPESATHLTLVPVDRAAHFRVGPMHVRELPRAVAAAKLAAPRIAGYAKDPARAAAAVREAWGVYRARGWPALKRYFRDATAPRAGVAAFTIAARASGPRVAVLALRLSKGFGVGVVIARQVEYLCARGYDVTVIVAETDGHHDASLAPYMDAGQLRVLSVGSPEEAAEVVVREGAAIAIAQTPPFFDVLPHLPASVIRVVFDHGEPPAELFTDADVRRGYAARKVEISRGVDLSVAISRFIQRDSGLADAQVCFNGNDHLLRGRSNLARLEGTFRRAQRLHGVFVVLNVTRFHADERRYKGADDFAAVRDALVRHHPDLAGRVRFVLAGRSDDADRAWAASRGLAVMSNPTDDELVAAYLDCDLYLTTSRWEGYNLGLAQALALGVPAIASARGAHPEFPVRTSDDPEELARWIAAEVDRPPEALAPLQRLRRATVYPWRDAAHRLETLVADAVARRGAAAPKLPPPVVLDQERSAPELSIVVLSKDRPDLIVPCLRSIEERCDVSYEVLVGDTGSTDPETLRFYETTPHAVHYLGFYNFSAGNNVLAARARGRYLLFLNNDTALLDTSFRAAIDFLEANPRVGCVGGYLLYPDRTLQHAGVRICTRPPPYHGIPEHLDRLRPFDGYPGRAAPREVVAVTGAMLLVEAATFGRLGGFDEAYVEEAQDIDLCLRLRREGRASVVHPALVAFHYENSTRTVKESPRDRAEFLRRFGALIEGELLAWQARVGLTEDAPP